MSNKPIHLDFLIVGAQKAGTTSLHDWLVQHDDVCLPGIKETHYFSHAERMERGAAWYYSQFPSKPSALIGEIDPEYMFVPKAAEQIKALSDVNKFIVVLRQPIQRAYSQYQMSVRRGYEPLPFDMALKQESQRLQNDVDGFVQDHQSYIARGLYSNQIAKFLATFPDGKFLFIKFDDLIHADRGAKSYQSICEFIGTKSNVIVDRSKSSNQASTPRFVWIRNMLYKKDDQSLLRKFAALVVPKQAKLKIAIAIDKLNQRNLGKNESASLKANSLDDDMIETILADIEKTEELTGLDLSDWKKSCIRMGKFEIER